ncbi:MAG TPA: DUF948 domain-containing protein [Gemmatimonadaceae bacterium]|nr:DUF948 domain-containing protein [Gemmatimonadaceae bacterium]
MTITAHVGGWLTQAAATLPDTIVTKPMVAESGWFTKVADVAGGLVSILLLVLVAALIPVALQLRKTIARVGDLVEKLHGELDPITTRAARVTDDVAYITTAVRTDVEQVSRTLREVNESAQRGLAASERRLRQLGALLDMAQEEAEQAVVSTAAALRGVRVGAERFREDSAALLGDDEDETELARAGFEDDDELEEDEDDGYDREIERSRRGTGPRVRHRGRNGGGA